MFCYVCGKGASFTCSRCDRTACNAHTNVHENGIAEYCKPCFDHIEKIRLSIRCVSCNTVVEEDERCQECRRHTCHICAPRDYPWGDSTAYYRYCPSCKARHKEEKERQANKPPPTYTTHVEWHKVVEGCRAMTGLTISISFLIGCWDFLAQPSWDGNKSVGFWDCVLSRVIPYALVALAISLVIGVLTCTRKEEKK